MINNHDTIKLLLDIYSANDNKNRKKPLIIFLHGGAFQSEDKNEIKIVKLCSNLASYGFITTSIQYNIGKKQKTKKSLILALLKSIYNTDKAINFLIRNHNLYSIDTSNIFLGGISAGAMVSLQYVFWDNDKIYSYLKKYKNLYIKPDSYQTNTHKIKGIINCWGAILDTSCIKNNHQTAILNFHGINDKMVPYKKGHPLHMFWIPHLYGSYIIHKKSEESNIYSILKSYKNLHHECDENSPYMDTTITMISNFVNELSYK